MATLGLSTSQLELIGVTKEDRANGYDTAVKISTASGQVLIALGTGGLASALSKGGTVAQAASGALLAFDASGNAVGVVQGAYDATQNGVTISKGAQVAGGRDLTPAQIALLGPGDVAAKLPRAHAELTALEHAAQNGLVPARLTKGLKIDKRFNARPAAPSAGLWIEDLGYRAARSRIRRVPRVGVDYAGAWAAKRYRFVFSPPAELAGKMMTEIGAGDFLFR